MLNIMGMQTPEHSDYPTKYFLLDPHHLHGLVLIWHATSTAAVG